MGVRSKFCARCAIVTNERIDVPQHKSYRNWSGTSAAMESDIIAEGFTMSEQMYDNSICPSLLMETAQ